MPDLQNLLSPNLCRNATLLHGKIRKLKRVICMQTLHGKSAESHWTQTVHLFKDCYPNLIDIENPLDKNKTNVQVETESTSPTNLVNSEESGQHFEDTSSTQGQDMQDQDIVQNRYKNEWNLKMK